jgi:PPK2 family polyphosphate:nucleotide phosphotransferase
MKPEFIAAPHPYLVPFDGSFRLAEAPTEPPPDIPDKKARKAELASAVELLDTLQRQLYAEDKHAVLLVFQAMDAAGKDSTIRAIFSGVDPAGCEVHAFKQPSAEELDHDFLWRTARRLPPRGKIGIFNRSYYEEVLAVRVHPEWLDAQKLPRRPKRLVDLWAERFESIRAHEEHLARNGTVILKFWLNVSRDEQKARFLSRLDEPEKNWKFAPADVAERAHWDTYMTAYEDALNATSRPHAPWYAIPADNKSWMRLSVAQILIASLQSLKLAYPQPGEEQAARFAQMREQLARGDAR